MVTITDNGLSWYNLLGAGEVSGQLDTIAVGTGTDAEDPGRETLQSELTRRDVNTSVVNFVQTDDPTLIYATIRLRGGLEVASGTEITEAGVISTATDPETLVWCGTFSPVPFDSGDQNTIRIKMDLTRVTL